jgi:hypothetical protein
MRCEQDKAPCSRQIQGTVVMTSNGRNEGRVASNVVWYEKDENMETKNGLGLVGQ